MLRRLAVHTNTYHTYKLDDALAGIAEAGFRQVDLSVSSYTQHVVLDGDWKAVLGDSREVTRQLAEYGLEAVSLSTSSALMTRTGLEHALRAVRWASEFELAIVNTALDGHVKTEEEEEALLASLNELGDAAEEAGVTIGLEIYGAIIPSGESAVPLLQRVGRPSIGMKYDTANVEYYSGKSAVQDLPSVLPYLVSVDLKDICKVEGGGIGYSNAWGVWSLPALGSGQVDFPGVLNVLDKAGFVGPLSVEIEFQGEPWPQLDEVNRSVRESYEYLQGLGLS
jgi:sugar phosphate isomerase/epimerase